MNAEQLERAKQIDQRLRDLNNAVIAAEPVMIGGKNDLNHLCELLGAERVRAMLLKMADEEEARLKQEFTDL